MTINEWIEKFDNGGFESSDVDTQINAGWYDWFCNDKSLSKKTKKLGNKLVEIKDSHRIDTENQYVFFKNNLRANGKLYDDFCICDIESGDVIYTIIPEEGKVWGRENSFHGPLFSGSWKQIFEWFISPLQSQ